MTSALSVTDDESPAHAAARRAADVTRFLLRLRAAMSRYAATRHIEMVF